MPAKPAIFNASALDRAASAQGHTTNAAIASHTGLDEGLLSRLRRNKRRPDVGTLVRIAEAYGLTLDELVIRENDGVAA